MIVEEVRDEASRAVKRGAGKAPERPTRRQPLVDAGEAATELAKIVGTGTAPKLAERLADAGRAFERERYGDAQRILKQLTSRAPGAPAVRELHGVTLYRLGRWRDAVKELEAFRTLTGSVEQHPVLADSYRALGRYHEVDELWSELRAASPSAALVAEGRIVASGALADRGDLAGAIKLLSQGLGSTRKLREHHLRLRYALGDLYERAGDIPKARHLFDQVAEAVPDYADVEARRRALGR